MLKQSLKKKNQSQKKSKNMLMPKKTKYRKSFRGRRKGNSKGGNVVAFGDFGLQAVETS